MRSKLRSILEWLTGKHCSFKIALLIFVWTLMCGLLIQLVLLPYVFPQMHAGLGMLKGTDGSKFHRIMLGLSESMRQEGWSAWRLKPGGQAVAGIGAVFYTLITPEPWALLPWNALLHTLAAFFMVELGKLVFKNNKLALASALPLAFFPSAFTWTAQMHNENYTVLGNVMVLYASALILAGSEEVKTWRRTSAYPIMLAGLGLIWMVREWMFQIIGLASILTLAFILLVQLLTDLIKRVRLGKLFTMHIPTLLMVVMVAVVLSDYSDFNLSVDVDERIGEPAIEGMIIEEMIIEEMIIEEMIQEPRGLKAYQWDHTAILPKGLDDKIKEMAYTRAKLLKSYRHGHTNFDEKLEIHSAGDMLVYAPRAAAVGMLAPFPEMWFSRSEKVTSGLTRSAAGVEMMLAYAMLPGLLYALITKRHNARIWVVLLLSAGVMMVMAIGMPNLGTIYRFRYPFFCAMIGMGTAGWLHLVRNKLRR